MLGYYLHVLQIIEKRGTHQPKGKSRVYIFTCSKRKTIACSLTSMVSFGVLLWKFCYLYTSTLQGSIYKSTFGGEASYNATNIIAY